MISQVYAGTAGELQVAQSTGHQELAEVILQRAVWLDRADRALLEQVFDRGGRTCEMAAMLQVHPRTVQRRIRSLVKHLTDPTVLIVLRRHRLWDAKPAGIALAYWVRRQSMRQIARARRMSLFEVRQQVQFVRGLIAGEQIGQETGDRRQETGDRRQESQLRGRLEHCDC